MRVPFAVGPSGDTVVVRQVERGSACGCTCPECGAPVLARKGRKVRWHFAHREASRCTGESALHAALVRHVAEVSRARGHDARSEYAWRGRRFDVALLTPAGRPRQAYEIAVTNRKDAVFIDWAAAMGVPVREAWLPENAYDLLASSDSWDAGVALVVEAMNWGDLWHRRGHVLRVAVCQCGNRKPSSRATWCARCAKARTCPKCGGSKKPGYGTCYKCRPDTGWSRCDSCGENWYRHDEHDCCYECSGASSYDPDSWRDSWR